MRLSKIRRIWAVLAAVFAVPLLAASIAYACTALATMDSPQAGTAVEPGQTVEGTGRGFSAQSPNDVEIRFNKRTGELLWNGRPDLNGNIKFSFKVPDVPSGQYVILGMQNSAAGTPVGGTPARMSLEVRGAPAATAPATPAAASEPAAAPAPASTPAPAASGPTREAPAAASPVAPAQAAEVVAAAPEAAPSAAPGVAPSLKRSATVPASQGSLVLPLALVATGLLLTMGAAAIALSGRREQPIGARFRR